MSLVAWTLNWAVSPTFRSAGPSWTTWMKLPDGEWLARMFREDDAAPAVTSARSPTAFVGGSTVRRAVPLRVFTRWLSTSIRSRSSSTYSMNKVTCLSTGLLSGVSVTIRRDRGRDGLKTLFFRYQVQVDRGLGHCDQPGGGLLVTGGPLPYRDVQADVAHAPSGGDSGNVLDGRQLEGLAAVDLPGPGWRIPPTRRRTGRR